MNSVWLTSPFVKFNTDNLIYNETLCSEAHFLNKFARDKYKAEDQNSSMSNERQGNFTIASNYSSKSNLHLQGGAQDEDVEGNCTITVNGNFHIKIDSKVSLKKSESRRTLSETNLIHSENVTCFTNVIDEANKIREVDVKTKHSSSNRTENINYVSNKNKSQLAANDTTEDQIEELLSCPFELVQIYPGNKENISDLDRNLSDISRQGSSMISFPKEDSKSSKSRVFDENDAQLSKIKCGQGDRACEQHPASNSQSQNESKAVEDAKEKNETVKLSTVIDTSSSASSDDNEKSCSTRKEKKRSAKERSRNVLKRSEELMNYLDHATTKMDCNFVDDSDTARSRKACTKFDETIPLVCESEKVLMEDLIGMEEVVSSLLKVDACNTDAVGKYSNKSNENNVTKSRCDLSSVTNSSDNDFLKRNDIVIKAKKRKFGSESKSIDLKESLQIATEKREKGKNISNTIETVRVNDKQNGGNRSNERKMTEYAIDDASNGMIEKNAKFSVDYRNIKICNLLSKIREQLYINFQKMESIWIQLQDTSPIDSVRSTMPLRLLVRIISRCKSYIHDSHDSCKAESMIAENLFNLVIELAKSVDQNKLVLENQERQIDSLLLKLYQEKSLYKKRIMMNEVVSFWDHGLREISDIMNNISDKLRTIITESEEKENVRNSSFRRKDGAVESKGPKVNLTKKESRIETQMSVALNKHNTINRPKSKTSMNLTNTQRHRDEEKLSYDEPLKIVERKMNDNISLNRYNATKHPKSKTSSKSLNIQRHQDVEKLSYNEPHRIVERKMNDNISLNRYNSTKHPKSKTSSKSLNIQRHQEVEKPSFNEPFKIVERKINDIVRYSEKGKPLKKSTQSVNFEQSRLPLSRQKYRLANNPQPAWRPGGVVKLPSSSSATTLTQKNRTLFAQANERANQLTDNIKEGKHGRSGESKKYRTPSLTIDSFKYPSRKYTMNPEATSKLKPKSRALKVCFKEDNGSSGRSESPSSERTLSERVNRQKTCKEAKVLKLLEEIIKSTAADKEDKRTTNKSVGVNYPNQTNSMDLERSTKPISIEEEIEIPQDEPTRDIDPNQVVQSRSKDTELFDKTEQLAEKMPERPPIITPPTDLASSSVIKDQTMDSKSSVDLENSQVKNNCNFARTTDAKCTADSKHSSSCAAEVESSNSQQTSASCASQKPQKNELKASRDSMTVKEERNKNLSSVNVCTNSHTMSLTILKEFLRDQGVDVDLLNRAEQCVRDKRKCRGCLKTKSLSVADVVTFTKQRIEPSENTTESSCCQGDMLKEIVHSCERNSADLKVAMKSFDQNCKDILKLSVPERKDTSTCTETENKDSSVQTSLRETRTKGVQIIIAEDTPLATKQGKETIETQTEMISTKHTGCCTEMMEGAGKVAGESNTVNSLPMAESTSVKDSATETVQVFCASKLTGTEWPQSNVTKEISDNYDQNARNFIEIWNEMYSKELCLCDDRDLTVKHCHLNRLNEDSSDRALVCLQNGGGCQLGFRESDSSSSSCCSQFPECSNCCAMLDPELNNFNNVISSETIATLQSAAIRARNMYRAIYFYQQHMENKLKEEEDKRKLEKAEKCEKSKNLSTVDSIDIIVNDSYHSCKYDVEILSRAEIASLSDESEYEISKSVSMLSTAVSYNGKNVSGEDGLEVGQKLSSTAVLEAVKSLMEVLIQKIDDVKVTQMDCVQTVSSRTCSKIHIELLKVENQKNEFSMSPFSRQNLLMLVYGVVCSIVFWSLQFTITCDVVA